MTKQAEGRKVHATGEELRAMYHDQGMSLAQMGRHFGVDSEVIRYHMKRHNIPRRPTSACPGKQNGSWNGGRSIDKNGYVLIHQPDHPNARANGYVLEHRLVMSRVLQRPLLRHEVVHHRDGNKQNNHPDNLALYSNNADHLRDELTGRIPAWSEQGRQRSMTALRAAPSPAWTDERRERARQRMREHWQNQGMPRRQWTEAERQHMRDVARARKRNASGSFV